MLRPEAAGTGGFMRHDGGLMIAFGAGIGCLVSIWNFFAPVAMLAPTTDVAGTPGAAVAIAATAILCLAGMVLAGTAAGGGLTLFLMIGALVGILGTGLAAWFLESDLLLALMLVCLVGWVLRVFTRRPAY